MGTDRFVFRGMERQILALEGRVPMGAVEAALRGPGLEVEADGGPGVRFAVYAARLVGVKARFLPAVRLSYPEVVWRLAVRHHGRPAWLSLVCDTAWHMRPVLEIFDRYRTRPACIALQAGTPETGGALRIDGGHGEVLAVRFGEGVEAPAQPEARLVLTRSRGGGLYEIPWDDAPAARAWRVRLTGREGTLAARTFGTSHVEFEPEATVFLDRPHGCSLALRTATTAEPGRGNPRSD